MGVAVVYYGHMIPEEMAATEWREMLDRRAREMFGMPIAELVRRYEAGEIPDTPDSTELVILASCLPTQHSSES